MNRLCWAVVAFCLGVLGSMAQAYDRYTEHHIRGDEIAYIVAPEIEIEAPMSLDLTFVNGNRLLIESDSLLDDCQGLLEQAQSIGRDATVEIVVHETADTMNGFWVTRCDLIRQ